jgi:hypothetical protein
MKLTGTLNKLVTTIVLLSLAAAATATTHNITSTITSVDRGSL